MSSANSTDDGTLYLCGSRKRYRTAAEVAWDIELGLDEQIRALAKWQRIAAKRYVESRSLPDLGLLRQVNFALTIVKRAQDETELH